MWQPWRLTAWTPRADFELQEEFDLEENETVVTITSNSDDRGWLVGREVTTSTAGRQFSWGDFTTYSNVNLRRNVVEGATLGFCSGMVMADPRTAYGRSITFHWMMK